MIEQPQLLAMPPVLCASAHRRQGCRKPRAATENRGHHINSLEAHEAGREQAGARRLAIVEWVRLHGPATDRQIRDGLFGERADMNMVRPRVSEAIDAGEIEEYGRAIDALTGRRVRRVRTVQN